MTVARPFVSVNEMSLSKTFLVVLVKTECMMTSKVVAIQIKIYFQLVSLIGLSCPAAYCCLLHMYIPLCALN